MPTQKEHLEALHPAYQALVDLSENLPEDQRASVRSELLNLGTAIQGLDLRIINDEVHHRITEGFNSAILGLVKKNAKTTTTNRNAANGVDGVLVDYDVIEELFNSIEFMNAPDVAGRSHTVLFHLCLKSLSAMFTVATPEENAMLQALAERAARNSS